jgi:hypothetical protein
MRSVRFCGRVEPPPPFHDLAYRLTLVALRTLSCGEDPLTLVMQDMV